MRVDTNSRASTTEGSRGGGKTAIGVAQAGPLGVRPRPPRFVSRWNNGDAISLSMGIALLQLTESIFLPRIAGTPIHRRLTRKFNHSSLYRSMECIATNSSTTRWKAQYMYMALGTPYFSRGAVPTTDGLRSFLSFDFPTFIAQVWIMLIISLTSAI